MLIALCAGFVYLAFTVLAPWQLGKNEENSYRNDQIAESMRAQPKPVGELFGERTTVGADDEWRQVFATGTYLADKQVLARLRSVGADPAFEVIVPFEMDDGRVILVNRGYVWPDDNMKSPEFPAPPAGTVTLEGRIRTSERTWGPRLPVVEGDLTQVYSIHTDGLAELLDEPLLGNYLQLNDEQPGGLGVIALPQLDAGPYLSYGLQWIAFGVMVPLGAGYFAWAEIRERRRRAPDTDGEPLDSDDPEEFNDPAPAQAGGEGSEAEAPDDLEHVMLGRRKRASAHAAPLTPQKAPLPSAQQATLAERYSKKR